MFIRQEPEVQLLLLPNVFSLPSITSMQLASEKNESDIILAHGANGTPRDNGLSGDDYELVRRNLETLIDLAKQKRSRSVLGVMGFGIEIEMRQTFVTLRDMAKLIEVVRQNTRKAKEQVQQESVLWQSLPLIVAVIWFLVFWGMQTYFETSS